jgi:hypothetical protein
MKPGDLVSFNKVFDLVGLRRVQGVIHPGDVGLVVDLDAARGIGVLVDGQVWYFRESDMVPCNCPADVV